MSKPVTTEILPNDPLDHRAVKAWALLKPARVEPERIEILKLKNKSAVYRLVGVGEEGSSVIAKRCRLASASVERMMYEEFLPRLPLPSVRYYGHVDEPGGEFCWLFLENAGGLAYAQSDAAHRALAAHWLVAMQTAAVTAGLKTRLPVRDADYYRALLCSTRDRLREHLANPELPAGDHASLENLASQFDAIEKHWRELQEECAGLPATLVHGDFVTKNVRVRANAKGLALLVFDWEYAGWGVPATDLSQFIGRTASPPPELNGAPINGPLRAFGAVNARRLAQCGKIFRLIDDISWAGSLLMFNSYLFLEKPMSYLRSYGPRIAKALREANWQSEIDEGSHA